MSGSWYSGKSWWTGNSWQQGGWHMAPSGWHFGFGGITQNPPAEPDAAAPSIPANLVATAVSTSQIDLTWDASTDNVGVDHYNVYRSVNGGAYALLDTAASNSYSDTGLAIGTNEYAYKVSAEDAAENESDQSDASLTVGLVRAGLVAEWRFDDGTGQVLTDYSGNAWHGQLGATTGAEATDPTWVTEGLSFDGGDYVIVDGAEQSSGDSTWTVCFVAKAAAASGFCIYGEGNSAGTNQFTMIGSGATDTSAFRVFLRDNAAGTIASLEMIPSAWDNAWHFYAARRNGTSYVATMDGFETGSTSGSGTGTMNRATWGALRRSAVDNQLTGSIAWGATYSTALTADQVAQNRAYAAVLVA